MKRESNRFKDNPIVFFFFFFDGGFIYVFLTGASFMHIAFSRFMIRSCET